ncbi:hypothetical protein Goklo_016238 [Gossypium klotzschianum]|uniref:RNase H type-1 domain-containing protein n=1 Tax=Gossypium klotzschianum TaxID=34286 RepID=A0A7J8UDK4_9ROSI|nr:hypothetical protein [Gossypium klotzschianum]
MSRNRRVTKQSQFRFNANLVLEEDFMEEAKVNQMNRKCSMSMLNDRLIKLNNSNPDEEAIAEFTEIKLALNMKADKEFAEDLGFQRILVEGDALIVIRKMKSIAEDNSRIGMLIRANKYKSEKFEEIEFRHASSRVEELAAEDRRLQLEGNEVSFEWNRRKDVMKALMSFDRLEKCN